VHFDTALNLVWALLGVIALASTVCAAVHARSHRRPAWLHIIGVALIIAALFPYISATDDLVWTENLATQHADDHSSPAKKTSNSNLIRLYETLDTPLACATCSLSIVFLAIWFVLLPTLKRDRRAAPTRAGRSPPVAASV
jgi:uncharacterized membrane protein HdeD (DUF308 family)